MALIKHMSDQKPKRLNNHQILEVCGVEIFKKIKRKLIIADANKDFKNIITTKQK